MNEIIEDKEQGAPSSDHTGKLRIIALTIIGFIAVMALLNRMRTQQNGVKAKSIKPLTSIAGYYQEEDVKSTITNGMSVAKVYGVYGTADSVFSNSDGSVTYMWTVDSRLIKHGTPYEWAFSGFTVFSEDGVVTRWAPSHMDANTY